jgi:type IV secretory pathway TraG/TraD family ATPase VirD4
VQTTSETGRRLLLPDEVRRMNATEQLLFVRGRAPVRAERLDYLQDPEYATLFDANPLHPGVRAMAQLRRIRELEAARATTFGAANCPSQESCNAPADC